MLDPNSKVVVGVRLYERVKNALKEKAELTGQSTSSYTAQLLTQHVESPEQEFVTAPHLQNYQDKIDNQSEYIEDLRQTIDSLQEELIQVREEQDGNSEQTTTRYNELNQQFEEQRTYISQLEEKLQTTDKDSTLTVIDQSRFEAHIKYLQQIYPQLSPNHLIELAISCAVHNESSFSVHTLRDHIKRNPDFFTTQSPNHATSSF